MASQFWPLPYRRVLTPILYTGNTHRVPCLSQTLPHIGAGRPVPVGGNKEPSQTSETPSTVVNKPKKFDTGNTKTQQKHKIYLPSCQHTRNFTILCTTSPLYSFLSFTSPPSTLSAASNLKSTAISTPSLYRFLTPQVHRPVESSHVRGHRPVRGHDLHLLPRGR